MINFKCPGIYCIWNKKNDKKYIGKGKTKKRLKTNYEQKKDGKGYEAVNNKEALL